MGTPAFGKAGTKLDPPAEMAMEMATEMAMAMGTLLTMPMNEKGSSLV